MSGEGLTGIGSALHTTPLRQQPIRTSPLSFSAREKDVIPLGNRYAPAYERFGPKISAIHFIGTNKPWHSILTRPPGTLSSLNKQVDGGQVYNYDSLVDRWYSGQFQSGVLTGGSPD